MGTGRCKGGIGGLGQAWVLGRHGQGQVRRGGAHSVCAALYHTNPMPYLRRSVHILYHSAADSTQPANAIIMHARCAAQRIHVPFSNRYACPHSQQGC